jgi:iron complex transport system substrate-binding protein
MRVERIASLLPAATEIVCALGLRERLVGVSHECDFPEDVRALPALSSAKVDAGRSSAAIDGDVRALIEAGLSLYRIDIDRIVHLQPDLIVTQDQCDVCAVPRSDLEDALHQAGLEATRVLSLRAETLYQVPADFRRVAEAAGVADAGDRLAASFLRRLSEVKVKASRGPARRVALVEWLDPPMIAGGWMPELARIAGASPVLVTDASHFRQVTWSDIAAADPEVVVLIPCGFGVERTQAELLQGSLQSAMSVVPAVRSGRVVVLDGNAYFNRPGPRLADSAEQLLAALHAS